MHYDKDYSKDCDKAHGAAAGAAPTMVGRDRMGRRPERMDGGRVGKY